MPDRFDARGRRITETEDPMEKFQHVFQGAGLGNVLRSLGFGGGSEDEDAQGGGGSRGERRRRRRR